MEFIVVLAIFAGIIWFCRGLTKTTRKLQPDGTLDGGNPFAGQFFITAIAGFSIAGIALLLFAIGCWIVFMVAPFMIPVIICGIFGFFIWNAFNPKDKIHVTSARRAVIVNPATHSTPAPEENVRILRYVGPEYNLNGVRFYAKVYQDANNTWSACAYAVNGGEKVAMGHSNISAAVAAAKAFTNLSKMANTAGLDYKTVLKLEEVA